MSNRYDSKARRPLFLFLLGTLAFSMSSIPGHKNSEPKFSTISLSSSEFADSANFTSTCQNMQSRIESGSDADSCEINPDSKSGDLASIMGEIKVKQVSGSSRDASGKVVTADVEWETTVKVLCVPGAVCPEGIGSEVTSVSHLPLSDFKSIYAKAVDDFKTDAKNMQAKIAQAKIDAANQKQIQARVDRCEIDENGQGIPANQRMSCQVGKLNGMDDDKSADYFEKNMLPGLKQLVGSDNESDQRKGMALLKQLNDSGMGGDFVSQSVHDLAQFGQYKYQAAQLRQQAALLPANDPRRMMMVQTLNSDHLIADNYFQSRGIAVGNETFSDNSAYNFNGDMLSNLTDLRGRIDQYYAAALQYQQQGGVNNMNTFAPGVNTMGAPSMNNRSLPLTTLPMNSMPRYTANH